MPRVLIADTLAEAADELIAARGVDVDRKVGLSKEDLIAVIGDYDGLAVRSACKPDADVIAAAHKLRVIGRAGIGVDNIDVEAATARGVVVMNTPFGNSITTAEHAIAMLMAAARQVPAANASTQAGKWEKSAFMGMELASKTLGIIGCGNIGSIVADRAQGLRMKVIAFDPYLSSERAVALGIEKVTLDQLLERAQAISLHTPLTDATHNILSAEALAKTRTGVIVVNCARGGLVDEAALRERLDTGHVRAAAFDVFAQEPARENPLFGATNFIATPHLGAATREAQEKVALQVAEQIADFLTTGAVVNALNMPSVSGEEAPRLRPYLELTERLGLLAGQLVATSMSRIEICYAGRAAAVNTRPLTAAGLTGVLRPQLEEVNMVSAPEIAKQRGVAVSEVREEDGGAYDAVIRITVETERRTRTVAGVIFAGEPRIVDIDGLTVDAPFAPHMIYFENRDKPGFIGALGTMLGAAGVNIATFNLGRKPNGGDALALVGVDEEPRADVMDAVRSIEHVTTAQPLAF